jgi:dipeptidyl-peptidase-4
MSRIIFFLLCLIFCGFETAFSQNITWTKDGRGMLQIDNGQLVRVDPVTGNAELVISKNQLKPLDGKGPVNMEGYALSQNGEWALIFTNTARVWRYNTRGDYWLLNLKNNRLRQIGKGRPAQSLMFAKLSPDASKVAYVSEKNIYVEDLNTAVVKQLTRDGKGKLINGTFDWVYEEEFFLRDGFRWSDDSKNIAYWQVDANGTRDFYMINNTDSVYSRIIPVEYPKVGQPISRVRVGVVGISNAVTKWMGIPGDLGKNYIVRLEWAGGDEVIVQQLDRKQQQSNLYLCNARSGTAKKIYSEKEEAWIDIQAAWDEDYANGGWDWLNKGREFLWSSEKDGWRHLYVVDRNGKEKLITKGNYDVIDIVNVDDAKGFVYFMASPDDPTSTYLYRVSLSGTGLPELLTPVSQKGTHKYEISPGAVYAFHQFSNYYTPPASELITLADHKGLNGENRVADAVSKADSSKSGISFFKIKTADGIEMDAWMQKPDNFDPSKKYPVVFYVYTEPWRQTVQNRFGITGAELRNADFFRNGYLYVSLDNRGTPSPKGRSWRKSIYQKIGLMNIHDQAMGAKEILKLPYADPGRVAVWGWSGGGTATLNLMFQYPEIYKTGISIAAVANQLTYDNVYQERYMGDPFESLEVYKQGSPLTYAQNLKGNLLYIHGTGDDNVHYQNAEMLVNELIRYNKQFQFMPYPNRSHGIYEGAGTRQHLATLFSEYMRKNCPPGGR